MALLDYPQNFLDEKGNPKPGVFGPSPASMGLLSAGLGILASPEYTSRPQGLEPLGQAGLQGLQAYQNRMNQIQQQRQAYNQSLMQAQNQEMAKQRFQAEVDERKRLAAQRERRVSQLPMLLEQIRNLPIKGIDQTVAAIRAQAEAGDVAGAYNAATGVIQQKLPNQDPIQTKQIPGTQSMLVTQGNEYKTVVPMTGSKGKKSSLIGPQARSFIEQNYAGYKIPDGQEPIVKLNENNELIDIKFLKTGEDFGKEKREQVNRMAEQWEKIPVVQNLDLQVSNLRSLEAWVNRPSGPGDVAIIMSFMKSLDPRSTVREAEYDTAAAAGLNVPESVFQLFKKTIVDGQLLSPKQRKLFVQVAKQAVSANAQALQPQIDKYLERGRYFNISDEIINGAVIRNPLDGIDLSIGEKQEPTKNNSLDTGPVDNNSADQIGSEAASLIFGQGNTEVANEPVQNPNFQYNDKGKITAVKVGENYDGAYKILQAAGVRPSKKNISRLYLANRALMKKDGTLPTASIGKFITIPPSLLRKQ